MPTMDGTITKSTLVLFINDPLNLFTLLIKKYKATERVIFQPIIRCNLKNGHKSSPEVQLGKNREFRRHENGAPGKACGLTSQAQSSECNLSGPKRPLKGRF